MKKKINHPKLSLENQLPLTTSTISTTLDVYHYATPKLGCQSQIPSADSRLPHLKEMKDLSEMSAGGYTEIEGMQCCTLSAKLRE